VIDHPTQCLIRVAEARDLSRLPTIEDAADELLIALFHPARWGEAPTGEARASTPGFILVAIDVAQDQAIGFAHVLEVAQLAQLEQVSVLPEHGRQGTGRALVEAAKVEAKSRGHRRMSLRTYSDVPWNSCRRSATLVSMGTARASR
jgi:GNAT superfamily N-acetyltransferase